MSSGGGTTQTSGEVIPYAPTEPYLEDILQQAENIYQSDVGKSYFPSSTVVPFAPQTQHCHGLYPFIFSVKSSGNANFLEL